MIESIIAELRSEPGGYLQWVERDWLSKFPKSASSTDDPHTQMTSYLHKMWPKTRYAKNIRGYHF